MPTHTKTNILLPPPGSFDSSFFDFYLHKYQGLLDSFNIFTLDLPSRDSVINNSLQVDGEFIASYINRSQQRWIVLGVSTSAASLIEALRFVDKSKVTSICLIFGGEFLNPRSKVMGKVILAIVNSNSVFRKMFFSLLQLQFGAYRRDKRLKPETLVSFYRSILDWKIPEGAAFTVRTLIVHAQQDYLVNTRSRTKVEGMFSNSKIITLKCAHEPSDKVGELLLKTLQSEAGYLAGG